MRALFVVVAVLAALYAGYWFVGRAQVETRAVAALAALEAEGWAVDYADLSTTGFPSRFDTTVTDLRIASPDGATAWEAPWVQVLALSYRPNRVIVAWPEEQMVTVAGLPLRVIAQGLRASAGVGLSTALALEAATLEAGATVVTAPGGEGLALDGLLAAVRQGGPGIDAYDVFVEGTGLAPRGLGFDLGLDLARLDARVTLDQGIGLRLSGTPTLRDLVLREARVARGDLAITASGALAPDARGFLEGEIVLVAENWRGMLDLAEAAGLLDDGRREAFERALDGLGQGEDRIEVPVVFAEGVVSALGLPLLAAPRVAQRQ